ncbi:MAG: hypothetical protein RL441_1544 [Actinomycetota bacterium]|jgi:hypothetical protein
MNLDDFENKFRETDPASSLSPSEAHHHEHMIERAMSADTSHVTPISRWTTRRKAASGAAAALLIGGLLAPSISGSMVAGGPERLVFTASARGVGEGAAQTDDAKMGMGAYAMWFQDVRYIAEGTFSSEAGTGAGYELVTRGDAQAIIRKIAADLGISNLKYDEASQSWSAPDVNPETSWFSAVDERGAAGQGSFSWYDQTLDPWYMACVDAKRGVAQPEDSTCTPEIPKNLPTNAAAQKLVTDYLSAWGLPTADLKFDTYSADGSDRYNVSVTATLQVDGYSSPISWYFTFGDNSALQSVSGSLNELKSLGVYDLIAPNQVIDRLDAMNAAQKAAWEKWTAENNAGATDTATVPATEVTDAPAPDASASSGSGSSAGSTGSGGTVDPSTPTAAPMPMPAQTEMVIHVTRVERTMVYAYLADGRQVWLPGFEIWGWQEGNTDKTAYQMNSVVGIVESQIDLNSLYSWGPMVAMDGVAVR